MNTIVQKSLRLILLVMYLLACAGNVVQAAGVECPPKKGTVSRAMFTTKVENREPVDQVLILEDKYNQIYFFSELRDLEGYQIIHRWEHDGKVVSEKSFSVRGPRWRVFSDLRLNDTMLGRWTVVVTTKDGCPLKAAVFQYVATDPKGQGSAILKLK